MTTYTMRCRQTAESQQVTVCAEHTTKMPNVDGDLVTASTADDDCKCEFCPAEKFFQLEPTTAVIVGMIITDNDDWMASLTMASANPKQYRVTKDLAASNGAGAVMAVEVQS